MDFSTKVYKSSDYKLLRGKKIYADKKKKEIESKRVHKASALRKYAKLCKREGVQSSRVRIDGELEPLKVSKISSYKTSAEKNALASTTATLDVTKDEKTQKENDIARKQREIAQAAEKRRKRKREINSRTRKGQPILGNQMKHILEKLQSDKS